MISNLEGYLKDDSPFKIGIEWEGGAARGLLAIGVNGKDLFKIKKEFQTSEKQGYALECRPHLYVDWFKRNLDYTLENALPSPGVDFVCKTSGVDYARVTGRHVLLTGRDQHQPLFIQRVERGIEISWDSSEQGLFYHERGMEIVPAELYEQKVKEFLSSCL